jgi:hypothetical protein
MTDKKLVTLTTVAAVPDGTDQGVVAAVLNAALDAARKLWRDSYGETWDIGRLTVVPGTPPESYPADDPRRGPPCGCGLYGDHDESHEDYDGDNLGPADSDGYVTLDRYRYYVSLGGANGISPGNQPANGYPKPAMAVYELARLMAERGEFPAAWMEGEHGPSARPIDDEVRAFHDAGGSAMLPLPGARFEPGGLVRWHGDLMEVVADYGTGLGVWLAVAGDHSAGDGVAEHADISPVYDEGQLIEFDDTWADGNPVPRPGLYLGDFDDDPDYAQVRRLGGGGYPPGIAVTRLSRTRPVSGQVMRDARNWVADNVWAEDYTADDIADLTDAQVAAGIEVHYTGGWAQFRRDAG